MQAQKQFDRLSIRDYVLIPCLVYPYKTLLQMVRHSIEDKRFSEKPVKADFELADKMHAEGIGDLSSDDLRELLKTRGRIEEERQSIEKTLEEIRNRLKKEQNDHQAGNLK
jgi:vacuolar-type H+-ATPase subunit I/STV1